MARKLERGAWDQGYWNGGTGGTRPLDIFAKYNEEAFLLQKELLNGWSVANEVPSPISETTGHGSKCPDLTKFNV